MTIERYLWLWETFTLPFFYSECNIWSWMLNIFLWILKLRNKQVSYYILKSNMSYCHTLTPFTPLVVTLYYFLSSVLFLLYYIILNWLQMLDGSQYYLEIVCNFYSYIIYYFLYISHIILNFFYYFFIWLLFFQ